jgi:hypothetical protein
MKVMPPRRYAVRNAVQLPILERVPQLANPLQLCSTTGCESEERGQQESWIETKEGDDGSADAESRDDGGTRLAVRSEYQVQVVSCSSAGAKPRAQPGKMIRRWQPATGQ